MAKIKKWSDEKFKQELPRPCYCGCNKIPLDKKQNDELLEQIALREKF